MSFIYLHYTSCQSPFSVTFIHNKKGTFHVSSLEHMSHKDFIVTLSGSLAAYQCDLLSSAFRKYASTHIPAETGAIFK